MKQHWFTVNNVLSCTCYVLLSRLLWSIIIITTVHRESIRIIMCLGRDHNTKEVLLPMRRRLTMPYYGQCHPGRKMQRQARSAPYSILASSICISPFNWFNVSRVNTPQGWLRPTYIQQRPTTHMSQTQHGLAFLFSCLL